MQVQILPIAGSCPGSRSPSFFRKRGRHAARAATFTDCLRSPAGQQRARVIGTSGPAREPLSGDMVPLHFQAQHLHAQVAAGNERKLPCPRAEALPASAGQQRAFVDEGTAPVILETGARVRAKAPMGTSPTRMSQSRPSAGSSRKRSGGAPDLGLERVGQWRSRLSQQFNERGKIAVPGQAALVLTGLLAWLP